MAKLNIVRPLAAVLRARFDDISLLRATLTLLLKLTTHKKAKKYAIFSLQACRIKPLLSEIRVRHTRRPNQAELVDDTIRDAAASLLDIATMGSCVVM